MDNQINNAGMKILFKDKSHISYQKWLTCTFKIWGILGFFFPEDRIAALLEVFLVFSAVTLHKVAGVPLIKSMYSIMV